jgi:hypothetical protein
MMYNDPPPTRCHMCWNITAYCTCEKEMPADYHEAVGKFLDRSSHPSVAGIDGPTRDRLLDAYAERGIVELERMVNGEISGGG